MSTSSLSRYAPCLQDKLRLTKQQKRLAKDIWGKYQGDLAAAKHERQQIVHNLQASGASACMRRGMQPDSVADINAILQQAAALAENSAIQQEITLHSHRQFILQVCAAQE